jgi:peptidoglycan LD-endopeptidase CwlK
MHKIIDANFRSKDVIIQNPRQPAPPDILSMQRLIDVIYQGFDHRLHKGQIVVAEKVIPEVEAFFKRALEIKFPIERVVPVSAPQYHWNGKKVLADNVTSGFDYRQIKGKSKLSLHSQGLAFDINPRQNPYIRFQDGKEILKVPHEDAIWDPQKAGVLYPDHPLVKFMEDFEWEWGGHWTPESGRTDYMHFQKNL